MLEDIFVGNGEMARLMHSYDWRQTALGSPETWSQTLRTTLNILLNTRQPMLLLWGEEQIQFYNDSYRPNLGAKHPQALGQKGKDCWQQDWYSFASQIEAAMVRGESVEDEDRLRLSDRYGYLEETYWSCNYSPVFEDGTVGGVLVICTETTQPVISKRRSQTLQALTAKAAEAKTVESAYRLAVEAIANNNVDISFALLYRLAGQQAELMAASGIEPGGVASPQQVNFSDAQTDVWKLEQVRRTKTAVTIELLPPHLGTLPGGAWAESPTTAIVLPIVKSGQKPSLEGAVVIGISPRRIFDRQYQEFVQTVASQIATVIANAEAYEAERQQAIVALRESEERFRQMAETIHSVFWLLDLQTQQHLYVSPAYEEIWGRTCESLANLNGWLETIHREDRQRIQTALGQCLIRDAHEEEYRIVRPDGSVRWVRDRGFVVRDANGHPYRLVGVAEDITERKQAQLALQESERRFRRLLESNIFGVLFGNCSGQLHYANDYLLHLIGYSSAEIQSKQVRWDELTPSEFASLDADAIQQLRHQGVCTPYEKAFWHKDGRRIPILIGAALLDDADENQEVVAFVLDLTQLRQITEERDRFFNLSLDMLAIGNLDGYFTQVNPAWEKNLGWSATELTTHSYLEFVHPDDRAATLSEAQKLSRTQETVGFENRYRAKDGSYHWLSWSICARPPQNALYAVARDVSDRKQTEQEQEKLLVAEQAAREAAEKASRVKDEFLAVLSHELRSPLNPILGWAQLLRHRKFDQAATDRALQTIERNAQTQTQLIDDLLDVSRIMRGKLTLKIFPCDLNSVIQAAIETVALAAQAKTIEISTRLDPNIAQVQGDSGRLQQVVRNLLTNAVKFTAEGGRVEVRLEQYANKAQIRVSDTGKGIDPAFIPYVFEGFRQEDYTITRKYGGLGLGLSIVRHIVELHGGTVHAASPGEGKGATFLVQLPLIASKASTDSSRSGQTARPNEDKTLHGSQILVVDDDADTRELLAAILTQAGAKVTSVACATAVLERLAQHPADLLISDLAMPRMDGYQLIRRVRVNSQIPAIALSAYANPLNQQQALTAGFQRHLAKPIQPDELIAAISALVHLNRQ